MPGTGPWGDLERDTKWSGKLCVGLLGCHGLNRLLGHGHIPVVSLTDEWFEFISSKETMLDGGACHGYYQFECANSSPWSDKIITLWKDLKPACIMSSTADTKGECRIEAQAA
jgi:hypothetical protein